MPHGVSNGNNEVGWLDVGEYLAHLKGATGRSWCVCVATTGELSKERFLLLSVRDFKDGTPVVCSGDTVTVATWPNNARRGLAATVLDMLYRFDRCLEERAQVAERQAFF